MSRVPGTTFTNGPPVGARLVSSRSSGPPVGARPVSEESTKLSLFTRRQFEANQRVRELFDELPEDHPRKEHLRKALAELDAAAKPVARGVMDASLGLPGFSDQPMFIRRAVEGAASVGAAIENTLSRIGLKGASDNPNQRRRAVEALQGYNATLDKDSILGQYVGPLVGDVTSSLSQGTLVAPAGGLKAVSALFGIQGADRAYVEAKDAGLSEGKAQVHGVVQGGIDGVITYLGGKLAGRLGLEAGEAFTPGLAKSVESLAERTGLQRAAGSMLLEAGEEGIQEFLTAADEVRSGTNPRALTGVWKRVARASAAGALGGGAPVAVDTLATKAEYSYKKFRAQLPDVVKGAEQAEQAIARNTVDFEQVVKPLSAKKFKEATGLVGKNKLFRDAYRERVVNHLLDEQQSRTRTIAQLQEETAADIQSDDLALASDTSVKKRITERDRRILELIKMPESRIVTFSQAMGVARENNVPARALSIAGEINAAPRAMTPVESAGVTIRMAELKEQLSSQYESISNAKTEADTIGPANEISRLQDEFDFISQAALLSGSERGRNLAFQKLSINNDFSLPTTLARARVNKGGKLTPAEATKFKTLTDNLAAADTRLNEYKGDDENTKIDLEIEQKKSQQAIRRALYDMKPKSLWERSGGRELTDLSRATIASIDFALGRQGMIALAAHPGMVLRNVPGMFKAFASKRAAFKIRKQIDEHPNVAYHDKVGLFRDKGDAFTSTRREELFKSKLAEHIPLLAGSERAYTTFLDKLRLDYFELLHKTLPKRGTPTSKEAKAIAHYVNVATGRGGLGKYEHAADMLSDVMFAPRYTVSRFQFLAGQPMWGQSTHVRQVIQGEYARFLGGMAGLYGLNMLMFGDDDAFSLTFDPRSPDFGKLVFGNTRIDPLAGLSQSLRIVARTASTQTVDSNGRVRDMTPTQKWDNLTRFVRSKSSPVLSQAFAFGTGETFDKRPATALTAVEELYTPLVLRDVAQTLEDQGFTRGTIAVLLSLMGFGTQVYGQR